MNCPGSKALRTVFVMFSMMSAVRFAGCSDPPDLLVNNPHDPQSPTFVPAAVSDVRIANPSEGSRSLSWVERSRGAAAYVVERKLGVNGQFWVLASLLPPATSYLDTTGIATDTTYFYRVVCRAANGNAAPGDSVPVRIPFPPPGDIRMTCVSNSEIRLEWTGRSTFETGFRVEQSVDGGPFNAAVDLPSYVTSAPIRQLRYGSAYRFRVAAMTPRNVSAYSNEVRVRSVSEAFERVIAIPTVESGLTSVTFSRDGSMIAGAIGSRIELWGTGDGVRRHIFSQELPGGWIMDVAFPPNGTHLVAAQSDHVAVLSVPDSRLVSTFAWIGVSEVRTLSYDETYSTLVCGTNAGVIVSDAITGTWRRTIGGPNGLRHAALSLDGQTIAAGDWGRPLTIYRVSDGSVLRSFLDDTHAYALALSPDGRTVATADAQEHTIRLWDVATGDLIHSLSPRNYGFTVAFSPDGQWVAGCGLSYAPLDTLRVDNDTMIWRVDDGTLVTRIPGFTTAVAFSPYGNLIAVAVGNEVEIWAVRGTWVMAT